MNTTYHQYLQAFPEYVILYKCKKCRVLMPERQALHNCIYEQSIPYLPRKTIYDCMREFNYKLNRHYKSGVSIGGDLSIWYKRKERNGYMII